MLFLLDIHLNDKVLDMPLDELWDIWAKEAEAAGQATEAGLVVGLYKVVGQRRVICIADAESHDQLDQILMAKLPMAHLLDIREVSPLRLYKDFATDVKKKFAD
ncbi:muconolactone Delta-isomerase [Candidatus Poribacteria bacterium]